MTQANQGINPNIESGKRHKDKLMILLSDYQWHSYYEIITALHVVNADRRLRNLREEGVELEEDYRRLNENSHPHKVFRLKDSPANDSWFNNKLQLTSNCY